MWKVEQRDHQRATVSSHDKCNHYNNINNNSNAENSQDGGKRDDRRPGAYTQQSRNNDGNQHRRLGKCYRQSGKSSSVFRVPDVRDVSCVRSCARDLPARGWGVIRIRVLLLLLLLLRFVAPVVSRDAVG